MKEITEDFCVFRDITTDYTFVAVANSPLVGHCDYITISDPVTVTIPIIVSKEQAVSLALKGFKEKENAINAKAEIELNVVAEQKAKFLSLTYDKQE